MKIPLFLVILFVNLVAYSQPGGYPYGGPGIVTIGGGISSSGSSLPADAAGVLTNDGVGGKGWLSLSSIGGASQTNINLNTIVGGGIDGQVVLRSPGGTFIVTNSGALIGYGMFTNQNAYILDGDSRAKSDNGGATTIQSSLSNYLVGSNWKFITNNGLGGQLVSSAVTAWPSFILDYKTFTASASGTNVIVIDLAGINDIVAFGSGTTVGSNYSRLMWLQKQSNCVVVAVGISPAYGLTDTQMANLKIANDIIFASSNWTYYIPAQLMIPPPPKSGMWADNIHNNSTGNDRIAFYINSAFLAGAYNKSWFYGFLDTPSAQSTGSAVDSTGQASSVFGVGSTTAIHIVSSSGANAWGNTAFGDTIYEEWNPAGAGLSFTAGNLRAAKTPTNTFFYGINAATNMAGFTTMIPAGLNTIALNQRWTNNFVQRADLIVDALFGDAATGDPVLHFTNSVSGESYTNGPRFGLTATVPMTLNFIDISPGDFGSFSNYSGTGATITIVKARWKLK